MPCALPTTSCATLHSAQAREHLGWWPLARANGSKVIQSVDGGSMLEQRSNGRCHEMKKAALESGRVGKSEQANGCFNMNVSEDDVAAFDLATRLFTKS
eukprot:scaffold485_cov272-Pinguiococcus_pyrenoidosus.AAC.3